MATYQLSIHPFSYNFVKPFKTANNSFSSRTGFYIKLGAASITAYAECSPLLGFSSESLEESLAELIKIKTELLGNLNATAEPFYEWLHRSVSYASLRFALSILYEDLQAQLSGTTFGERLGLSNSDQTSIALNAVFGLLPTQELFENGLSKLASGFSCIKLKAPEKSVPALIQTMQKWHKIFPNAKFRLDANGEWSAESCLQTLTDLAKTKLPIEYIEQPILPATVEQMAHLSAHSQIPIAADEMLVDSLISEQLIHNKAVDFLVIKPPIIGSIPEVMSLINKAAEQTIQVVITTLLDSGLNRNIHALIADYTKTKQPLFPLAHGLSTGSMLTIDLCKSPLSENGTHWKLTKLKSLGSLFKESLFPKSVYNYQSND